MKSLWNGSISFGLVNIPVRLVSSVRDHRQSRQRPLRRTREVKDYFPLEWEYIFSCYQPL